KEALRYLRPPENISVSEWAEKYRVLDSKSSAFPGPWRNDKTPYLTGIMDEFLNYETEEIIFSKPSQIGGTEILQNLLGYIVQQDPAPTMVVYPTDTLAESVSANRLKPMFRASPTLKARFRETESSKLELQFEGMYLSLVGSNSPSSLASKPIRFLFMDEVDKYPGASKKEADPIALARERTKTFHNRKIYMTSTPTLRTGHITKALEDADCVRHYFVPCPHCGKYIDRKCSQGNFPNDEGMSYSDRAECAVYICQECGCVITDQHKPQMLRYGEWRNVQEKTQFAKKVGFWINTLYSPFVRFSEVVKEFLMSKDDPDKLQNFVNSWLAEPWEDTKLKTTADLVLERQTELQPMVVPEWAKLLTAGVDVQENCLYWTIRAWGNFITSQNIAHGQAFDWAELERVMNLQYPQQGESTTMVVQLALVDSGNNADEVYDFCASNSDWALPCKGASNPMMSHYKLSKVNKTDSRAYGMNLVLVDGGKYKDMIAGRMKRENGSGIWMVYADCDREYAEQVTAEHKVNVRSANGRVTQAWKPKASHADNHYLDCEVYAMAAADVLGVRTLHLDEVEQVQPRQEAPPPTPTPEENWIRQNESWI
ncbi:MAG: phage terminase large subunit family protein, partial [Lachnospiraceae bacterium]|nr:phage terminase large subunit family protein [Lachnospiraceae bacterium]